MTRRRLVAWIVLPIAWSLGCTPERPAPPPAAPVKGTVRMDGKPLPAAELHFTANGVPPAVLAVKDGQFAGEVSVGKYQVELVMNAEGPPVEKYGGARMTTNVAPQKYWGPKTTLAATVAAGEPNEFKFDLSR